MTAMKYSGPVTNKKEDSSSSSRNMAEGSVLFLEEIQVIFNAMIVCRICKISTLCLL